MGARSKFRAADGETSWLPCDVVAYEEKGADHFLLEWHDTKKLKWATRFNVLFNAEDEAAFHARLAAAVALRRRVEGDARRFFADHNPSGRPRRSPSAAKTRSSRASPPTHRR